MKITNLLKERKRWGVTSKNQVFRTNDLAKGDVMFSATGVTDYIIKRG